jgi:hypothetical protein
MYEAIGGAYGWRGGGASCVRRSRGIHQPSSPGNKLNRPHPLLSFVAQPFVDRPLDETCTVHVYG